MLNDSGKRGRAFIVPDLEGTAFSLSHETWHYLYNFGECPLLCY